MFKLNNLLKFYKLFKFNRNLTKSINIKTIQTHITSKFMKYNNRKIENSTYLLPLIIGTLVMCETITKDDELQLFHAIRYGNIDKVKNLIKKKHIHINVRHEFGWTPLMLASVNGQNDLVEILLKSGANPNLTDEYTNIIRLANQKGLHPIEILMIRDEEFSNVLNNKKSFGGFTALHYAVLTNHHHIVHLLLTHGADPTIENESGQTPLTIAKDDEMKRILNEAVEKFTEKKLQEELDERRRHPLEDRLREHIVGQEGAITAVAAAIRRKQNGWMDDDHPLVFLFLGSSGIGKTELAKQLARYLHKNPTQSFIRLDMSEYQEKHEVAKLIGAPPGYVGHDDGGQLTKRLKLNPNALVLFDEIDKAHTDVLTVLLQLLDEGRLTDGHGQTISCKNAIFIMTSNLANDEIANYATELRDEYEQKNMKHLSKSTSTTDLINISKNFHQEIIKPILKKHFKRDEFLGRINEIIYFLPFSRDELFQLVHKELIMWSERARNKHQINLIWDKNVEILLADGYDINYGARSIKYEVERKVINQIAAAHENGVIRKNSNIFISVDLTTNSDEPKIKLTVKHQNNTDFLDVDCLPIRKTTYRWCD